MKLLNSITPKPDYKKEKTLQNRKKLTNPGARQNGNRRKY